MADEQFRPASPPLARYLASTDKRTRDKAVESLAAFLSTSDVNALSKTEMAKLWKGIFYCYWMSDKPLVQQALASELAELLLTIAPTTASLSFLQGFWEAVVREWNGIDRLRMDKYYMLVRKFVNASFRLLIRDEWEEESIKKYNNILTCNGGPLCPEDTRVPTSLSYHLSDIYLEELEKALTSSIEALEAPENSLPVPLSLILRPFFDLTARTPSNITYQRVYSAVLEPLFVALKPDSPSTPSGPSSKKRARLTTEQPCEHIVANPCLERPREDGKMEAREVRKMLLREMFDVASGPDVREANRRKMYTVWRAAMSEEEEDAGGGRTRD